MGVGKHVKGSEARSYLEVSQLTGYLTHPHVQVDVELHNCLKSGIELCRRLLLTLKSSFSYTLVCTAS